MKRDMNLIRLLLLKLEEVELDDEPFTFLDYSDLAIEGFDDKQAAYHLELMVEAGLIDQGGSGNLDNDFMFKRLTWRGHDFVDAVRDEEVWRRTREGALAAGGWSLDLLRDLAKGYIRKKAADLCDVQL
ncbi:DUF2513 domain-containing protein [Pseudomonas flexibilis]|uniref:DUF2513 domain-containing protein n=1 Tax=Pseudomonas flexibilis TaxID=706570 RepID=A0A1N6UKR0_9PSED|nr:DUF2513 domain-containing protein [Pseudomonas flexibilis]SIQ66122.1 Hypothetical protein SAMN05421672_108174 [Pseudomonas flexibilis]